MDNYIQHKLERHDVFSENICGLVGLMEAEVFIAANGLETILKIHNTDIPDFVQESINQVIIKLKAAEQRSKDIFDNRTVEGYCKKVL